MILDIILVAVLFVWAVFGYRKGFIKQIFVLAGIIAVIFLGPPLSDIVQKVLQNEYGIVVAGRILHGLLFAGCSSLIYIVFYTIGYFLHDTLVKGIPLAERTNHILGATLGIFESVVASYLILGVFAVGASKIEEYAPAVHSGIKQSVAYQVVSGNNIFEHFDYFQPILEGRSGAKTDSEEHAKPSAGDGAGQPPSGGDADVAKSAGSAEKTVPSDDSGKKPAADAVGTAESASEPARRGTVHRKVTD